jgi:hypothetical protein
MSAMKRDQQRAFEAWRGEQTVWLMPGLAHPYGWNEGQDSWDGRLAVPATELEDDDPICYKRRRARDKTNERMRQQ